MVANLLLTLILPIQITNHESCKLSLLPKREQVHELDGNHFITCKFEAEIEQNWKTVERLMSEMVRNAVKVRERAEVLLETRLTGTLIERISLFALQGV